MGTTPLLFCTANLDVEVIEDFITESTRSKGCGNIGWCLVRSPDEPIDCITLTKVKQWWPKEHADVPDYPPIKPFKTGFLNTSVEELGKFVQDLPLTIKNPDPEGHSLSVSKSNFIVLDERSAKDRTVLVYSRHIATNPDLLEKNPDAEGEGDDEIKDWVELRMRWMISNFWTSAYPVGNQFADFKISAEQYIDDDGIFQCPWVERSKYDFGELPEDEYTPLGPEVEEAPWRFPESHFVDEVKKGTIKTYPM